MLPAAAMAALPVHPPATYVAGEVIVKYRPKFGPAQLQARLAGFTAKAQRLNGRIEILQLPSVTTVPQALALLREDPAVEYAEPNFRRFPRAVTPNDPLFGEQWALHSTGQANYASADPALASIPGADMDLLAAWDPDGDGVFDRVGDGSATVAIIDDSFATGHPDLRDNFIAGRDFASGDSNPNPDAGSDQEHGTLVAGCVGAVGNNGLGVAGVAWNVKLMPLKFAFDTGSLLGALDFARANGADIVNASFGGPSYSQAEVDAIQALADDGILFVAAAGNDDSNTDVAELNYPANYPVDNIVSVAATNRQDDIASFSQYGPLSADVAAPGLQIVTTANPTAGDPDRVAGPPGVAGTSFASPYTAGIAALLKMAFPAAGFAELKARLVEGAEPGAGNALLLTGAGRVNAARSLELAPGPSLVIREVRWADDNGAPDAGETAQLEITLANLWQDAVNVVGTLSADQGFVTAGGPIAFGDVGSQQTVTRRFDVAVPQGIADHRYVRFTLALAADGGYGASRHFIAEIGDLGEAAVTQAFAPLSQNLYDEFHAWHYDLAALPEDHNQLVIETTAPADIDLLVKKGTPPRYSITVGINPETDVGFFCTSGTARNCHDPDTEISADTAGNEAVVIDNPTPGTYHIVIVNFAQLENGLRYGLRAYTRDASAPDEVDAVADPAPAPDGGGGALAPALLGGLGMLALLRRRRA